MAIRRFSSALDQRSCSKSAGSRTAVSHMALRQITSDEGRDRAALTKGMQANIAS